MTNTFEEIEKKINELVIEIMKSDDGNKIHESSKLLNCLSELQKSKEKLDDMKNQIGDFGIEESHLSAYLSELDEVHNKIERHQNAGGTGTPKGVFMNYTLSPLIERLPVRPYSTTSDFFGVNSGSNVTLYREHVNGNPLGAKDIDAGQFIKSLYPGSALHRFAKEGKILVRIGRYFDNNFIVNLRQQGHTFDLRLDYSF